MNEAIDFDKAFDSFIDSNEYDGAASVLYELMRRAFQAGWTAAGAQAPPKRRPLPPPEELISFPSACGTIARPPRD